MLEKKRLLLSDSFLKAGSSQKDCGGRRAICGPMSSTSSRAPSRFLASLRHDLPASVVVFLVALPLCLGIALASGAPLLAGIFAGVIGGIVVGSLGGSAVSVSGPAAGLTVIVASGIAEAGNYAGFLTAVVLAGVLQVALGFVRAGVVVHFVPACVVRGMLAAIGLILILKQIPHALGVDSDFEGDEAFAHEGGNTFTDLLEAVMSARPGAVLVFVVALVALLAWNRIGPRVLGGLVPGPLVAVVAGTLVHVGIEQWWPVAALEASHRVGIPAIHGLKGIADALPFPDFDRLFDPVVLRLALTLGLVASVETLLSVEASDRIDPLRRTTSMNRELKAQGVANVMAGLIGALPITAVIVRSSANVTAGGRTKTSAIAHGVLLLIAALFMAPLLQHIPLAALAAVLIAMGWKLTRPRLLIEQSRRGLDQSLPFAVTIVAILLTDLLVGVLLGIAVGVFFVVRSNFHSALVVTRDGDQLLIRFAKDVSFLNKPTLIQTFAEIPEDSHVMIDGTRAQFIDRDIAECIEEFIETAPRRGIAVEIRRSQASMNPMFKELAA
jgi:MFS superfamily sulfate permease-like transporter